MVILLSGGETSSADIIANTSVLVEEGQLSTDAEKKYIPKLILDNEEG
ncbi:5607_t:CDS:2 [Entrophospora sp. SA101]|nr:5607_t:CDS:2 [Entrophospora sp. SA101]